MKPKESCHETPTAGYIPKMRWLVEQNHFTSEQVRAEQHKTGDSLAVCKARLAGRTEPVLQFYSHEALCWENVPVVFRTIYRCDWLGEE